MKKQFRKGVIGALMDEYESAAIYLKKLVEQISEKEFVKIIDSDTSDEDCRAVQTIVSHIINSGYGYANYLRDWYSISINSPARKLYSKVEFEKEFDKMIVYTSETLDDKWEISEDEIVNIKVKSQWGPEYNLEQLLEHAILHILRHRRQIEKFIFAEKITLNENK
jgi:uncharacterized damage-inducible protein DinB